MNSTTKMEDLADRIAQAIPAGEQIKEDIRKNVRAILNGAFERMELVTREEFDVQTRLLARTREKLDRLEQLVTELETQLNK